MDCKEIRSLIPLSLDGELEAQSEAALAAHLAACAACRAYRQQQEAALAAIRRTATYHRAGAPLRARIVAALPAAADRGAPPRWTFAWRLLNGAGLVAAACAALVLAIVLPLRQSAGERLADDLVASHARALLTDHVVDVAASDQHTVKPWFAGKLDFSPPVRDFADRGFPLAGGRLDYVDRRAVAVLVYRRRLHWIDVFIWPSVSGAAEPAPPKTLQGYHVIGKTQSGMVFRAVSDVDSRDLQQLVDLL